MTLQQFIRKNPVTIFLVLGNILWFLFIELTGSDQSAAHMVGCGAIYAPYILNRGEYWRLISAMFVHFSIDHLAHNMLLLLVLGNLLEEKLGSLWFAGIYLLTGLAGNGISLLYHVMMEEQVIAAGASGAVFGLIGCLVQCVLRKKGMFEKITGRNVILLVVLSLYSGFSSAEVNNMAHLAGLASGMLIGILIPLSNKNGIGGQEDGKR